MVEALTERSANKTGGRSQTLKRFLALSIVPEHCYENAAMMQIRRYLHCGYGRQTDAGILNFALYDFTELDTELFFNSIDSSALHLNDLDVGLNRALGRNPFGLFRRFLQHFLEKLFVRPDDYDTHLRPLPQILMIHL